MRLDKYLAEASVGTRKIVRTYIIEGKITVNDKIILEPATEIDDHTDIIKYQSELITHAEKVYYMFHKPAGCVTARTDCENKTVLDYFQTVNTNGLFPVGRLDKDTEGLLFLTNDGHFDHKLMHPDKHIEKTYYFKALGSINEEDKKRLEKGICIDKEKPLTNPAKIRIDKEGLYLDYQNEYELTEFISKRIPEKQTVVSGFLTISEGCKHQVKRMLKAVGCYVVHLKRISIKNIHLDETLEKGHFRALTETEIEELLGE